MDCCICFDPLENILVKNDKIFTNRKNMIDRLGCKHMFHHQCIKNWIIKGKGETICCPVCRHEIFYRRYPFWFELLKIRRSEYQEMINDDDTDSDYSDEDYDENEQDDETVLNNEENSNTDEDDSEYDEDESEFHEDFEENDLDDDESYETLHDTRYSKIEFFRTLLFWKNNHKIFKNLKF